MTLGRLLLRNLFYHWRGNLAVLLGVVVGTAVLIGALLVGDSLRGSLRDLTLNRLGWVEHAMIPGRFVREELATGMNGGRVSPVLLLQGSAQAGKGGPRVPKVVLCGVDERFWPEGEMPLQGDFWRPPEPINLEKRSVVLSAALARDLEVRPGQMVTFSLQKVSSTPRETVLGRRKTEDVLSSLPLTVGAVLADEHLGSRFSLNPSPSAPRNAFVPLRVLQDELRGQEGRARTLPEHPVNALLVEDGYESSLDQRLQSQLSLEDWGLVLRTPRERGAATAPGCFYLSLESRQLFLEPNVLEAVENAGLTVAPTLVYMVNNLTEARRLTATAAAVLAPPSPATLLRPGVAYYGPLQVPYSVVAALEPDRPPPLGPFLPAGLKELKDNQILLVDWEDSPLAGVRPGTPLALTYFQAGAEGSLREETAIFELAAIIPLQGAAADPNLTPHFPGVTDRTTLGDWDPPFPFDRTRIRRSDEQYWREHRATPRAYITLKAGQHLWGSRFGQYTSLRVVPKLGQLFDMLEQRVLARLHPEQAGLVFTDVRGQALQASAGGTDFGLLFLGFSVFLIAAALLLVGLLFRLNLDRRAGEIGLLLASGFRRSTVRRLLLLEGGTLAVVGGLVGTAGAVLYAWLMLELLSALWPGGLDRSFLRLHTTGLSLGIGYTASLGVSLLTVIWATRVLGRVSPSTLLAGGTTVPEMVERRGSPWSGGLAGAAAVGACVALAAGTYASDHEIQAVSFFGSGTLLLTALLAGVWAWLLASREHAAAAAPTLTQLGVRNAARHPLRSLLTVGLLASATFLVVAVQAFHRDPGRDFLEKTGGSGGFPLLAESEVPIYQDLNSDAAWEEQNLSAPDHDILRNVVFYPFRVSAGDDASCLNLYKPLQPRLMGVSETLIARGGFHFAATEAQTAEERKNPWLLLRKEMGDGSIPAFGEANTVQWMLKSGLGRELQVSDGRGRPVRLRIVGLLQDSVFQGELLIADGYFLKLYPRQEGFPFFLIETPSANAAPVKAILEDTFAGHGLAVTPTAERLQSYLAVENTYLATFQALGGLGLLLGALGLAVVLLRSVWERRAELALLRALGFRRSALGWLVLAETGYLLVLGLGVGTAAALLAVTPPLLTGAGEVLWLPLVGLLGLVLAVGLAAAAAAVAATVRAPVLTALRRE